MQLSLWDDKPHVEHQLIEAHYIGGRRRILDTANPEDDEAFRDMSVLYAGFVENSITPRCAKGNGGKS